MSENRFTPELKRIFKNIKENIISKYPTKSINIEYFLLAIIEDEKCIANQIIDVVMLSEAKSSIMEDAVNCIKKKSMDEGFDEFENSFNNGVLSSKIKPKYDETYDKCITYSTNTLITGDSEKINSGHILISALSVSEHINKMFSDMGVNAEQLIDALISVTDKGTSGRKNKSGSTKKSGLVDVGVTEKTLINLNERALEGRINEVIHNEDITDEIFRVFAKRERNNVIITGKPGVGKTDTVKHLANLLARGEVPNKFKGHKLMQIDFPSMASAFSVRGAFESLFKSIIDDAVKRNCYIFFIDDIHNILSDKVRFTDMNIENILDMALSEPNIYFICTSSDEGYSNTIHPNNFFKRRIQRIVLNEKSEEESVEILNICKWKYELYHNVTFTEEAIRTCVKMSKRYIPDAVLPDVALDILDCAGADMSLSEPEDAIVKALEDELSELSEKITKAQQEHNGDEYDKLVRREVSVKSKLNEITKENELGKIPQIVDSDEILSVISVKASIPVSKMGSDERTALSNLEERIAAKVIGQEEAVSETAKTVKRQRVGIGKHGKPSVMMFIGNSGTGKTYLAKTLAAEVFGDESAFIRLDMSEYSDKTSVNKITGSSPGYIGYDKGGILTEAVKKRSHCVLLLDEMEKADENVFDVFLQLFDDGRLTDNKGTTVDFSNVIVIMTSNVGAREASLRGGGVGFLKSETMTEDIIKRELRKRFKPEFINRIDNIIMFNNLTDENLKQIVNNEVKSFVVRLRDLNFDVDENFVSEASDHVYSELCKENENKDFGARPILRLIRREIEDKITDYIIDNNPENGYIFKFSDVNYPQTKD